MVLSGGKGKESDTLTFFIRILNYIWLTGEATSALDSKAEIEVMENIASIPREIAVIVAAHRLSSLIHCDRIFKVENGSLSEIQKAKIFG